MQRESMEFDMVVVGAGPSGLAAAIRVKQLDPELSVCVLEKGSEVGAHILSGAVFEPRVLDELIPDWRARGAPELDLTDLNGLDPGTKPWEQRDAARSTFSVWRDSILSTIPTGGGDDAGERLSALDPAPENELEGLHQIVQAIVNLAQNVADLQSELRNTNTSLQHLSQRISR